MIDSTCEMLLGEDLLVAQQRDRDQAGVHAASVWAATARTASDSSSMHATIAGSPSEWCSRPRTATAAARMLSSSSVNKDATAFAPDSNEPAAIARHANLLTVLSVCDRAAARYGSSAAPMSAAANSTDSHIRSSDAAPIMSG